MSDELYDTTRMTSEDDEEDLDEEDEDFEDDEEDEEEEELFWRDRRFEAIYEQADLFVGCVPGLSEGPRGFAVRSRVKL